MPHLRGYRIAVDVPETPHRRSRMPRPIINADDCSGCGICIDTCPEGVIELVGDVAVAVNEDDCEGCATCMEECPMGAITEIEEG